MTDHFAQDVVAARQYVKQCEAATKEAKLNLDEHKKTEAHAKTSLMTLIDKCDQPRLPLGERD